jgi:regulator of sigma E protease
MNLILAVAILSAVMFAAGMPTNVINELSPELPAMRAGLLPGDRIVRIDDKEIEEWTDITDAISQGSEKTVAVAVERDGEVQSFTVDVVKAKDGRRIIGITPAYAKDPVKAIVYGTQSTFEMGGEMIKIIGQLITGEVSTKNLTGPVGIVYIVGDTAKLGVLYLAQLTAFISLNLAIVNMLPFPALDGGRLLFLVIRKMTGRTISDETEGKIHFVGLMLLFGLMIYITFQDVGRFIL